MHCDAARTEVAASVVLCITKDARRPGADSDVVLHVLLLMGLTAFLLQGAVHCNVADKRMFMKQKLPVHFHIAQGDLGSAPTSLCLVLFQFGVLENILMTTGFTVVFSSWVNPVVTRLLLTQDCKDSTNRS